MVKVDPRLGSLSTVISPPIIWQKRLLIASPRPVPPYLLAVAEEAWENSWNSLTVYVRSAPQRKTPCANNGLMHRSKSHHSITVGTREQVGGGTAP
jgi:hypothetical protein